MAHELWECGLEDHRTIICRLCYLLSERLLDPARVGTDDLDLLDAAQDFVVSALAKSDPVGLD